MLKRSAFQTLLGRGWERLKESYYACLVRYQHGKFAAAANLVFTNELRACLEVRASTRLAAGTDFSRAAG